MKKLTILLSILFLMVLSCGKKDAKVDENTPATGVEKTTEEKVLRVGTNPDFKPFEYIGENKQVAGFDIDLMNMIGEEIGYKIEWNTLSFDGLIPALKAGQIDAIIAGMSATEERKKAVDFSDVYYYTQFAYVKLKDNNEITKLDDLKDRKIGAQMATIQDAEAKRLSPKGAVANESIVTLIQELKNKGIEAIVLEDAVASNYVSENPELVIFDMKSMDENVGAAIAFDKDKNTELVKKVNDALKKLKENGKYDELLKKYNLVKE